MYRILCVSLVTFLASSCGQENSSRLQSEPISEEIPTWLGKAIELSDSFIIAESDDEKALDLWIENNIRALSSLSGQLTRHMARSDEYLRLKSRLVPMSVDQFDSGFEMIAGLEILRQDHFEPEIERVLSRQRVNGELSDMAKVELVELLHLEVLLIESITRTVFVPMELKEDLAFELRVRYSRPEFGSFVPLSDFFFPPSP